MRTSDKGPFTDELVRHYALTVQTQHGIIQAAEAMAQILAEAGRASQKAVGDSPEYAVRRWSTIIRDRALELLKEEKNDESQSARKRIGSDIPRLKSSKTSARLSPRDDPG